jgi:hypothetical protein
MLPCVIRLRPASITALLSGLLLVAMAVPAVAEIDCIDGYKELANKPRARAMAVTDAGSWCAWVWSSPSQKEANRVALAECRKKGNDCRLLDAERDIALLKKQQQEEREKEIADIKEAQTKLQELGLYSGKIDGRLGPETTNAIKKAQRKFDLTEDGSISRSLLAKLSSAVRTTEELCNVVLDRVTMTLRDNTNSYHDYVEAQRRGITATDCRLAVGVAEQTSKPRVSTDIRDDREVCTVALSQGVDDWSRNQMAINSVYEAKRRGLSLNNCRRSIGLVGDTRTTKEVCKIAISDSQDQWSANQMTMNSVYEAKRRGLSVDDCRVAIGLAPLIAMSSQTPILTEVNPPSPKPLSLTELCEQSLNSEKTGWNTASSAAVARKQADIMGVTVEICRVKLGLANDNTANNNETPPAPAPAPAAATDAIAGGRVALVVGINDYENLPKLQKAVNDSRAVSKALTRIGYDVVSVEDPDRRTLSKKLSELQSKIQVGDNALFYFAGHGVAMGGENILIAKDMPKPASGDEDLVRDEGFSVDDIVRRIQKQGAKTAFLVLDACRDNPFEATGTRSIGTTRGLAKTDTPSGVFVLFSAGIGQAALDRLSDTDSDPNSVFTRKLLPALAAPAVTHIDLAKKVQKEVAELASTINHQQQPAYYDQIIGEVVINPQ